MNKKRSLTVCFNLFIVFQLIAVPFFVSKSSNIVSFGQNIVPTERDYYLQSFDKNDNKIHDSLDVVSNIQDNEMLNLIVEFNKETNSEILSKIEAIKGQIIKTWSIVNCAEICLPKANLLTLSHFDDVNFISGNFRADKMLSTSLSQINIRPYVWDTLSYEGEPDHSIAFLDTGIDDSHPDFDDRIIFWRDFIGKNISVSGDEYATTSDMNGHGTHCASIAVGSGDSASNDSEINVSGAFGIPSLPLENSGKTIYIEIESPTNLTIDVTWEEYNDPFETNDSITIILDSNKDGAFDFINDDYVIGNYSDRPISLSSSQELLPGKYSILINAENNTEISNATFHYNITRSSSDVDDGYNKYRGIAPNCKIVSLKVLDDTGVGSSSQILDALDWLYTNGLSYNIQIICLALGLNEMDLIVDTAVNNLVSLGYICVAAAGNGFVDDISINSPGTAQKAITVGAINDLDQIALYSSNNEEGFFKPDIVAPGGSYLISNNTYPILASDSNDADFISINNDETIDNYWDSDLISNDYSYNYGTSLATAHVVGLCALIIQAMGSDWTHSESDALRVKNYLCGTATEVRSGESSEGYHNMPILNRGNSDFIEGFGKVHADAAIEAHIKELLIGTNVSDSLNNSVDSKQSWAREVKLVKGAIFTAEINFDLTTDYDLYLYDPLIDMSIYQGIITSSTRSFSGSREYITFTPTKDMVSYLVIKRVSGSGNFTLITDSKIEQNTSVIPTSPIHINIFTYSTIGLIGLACFVFLQKTNKKNSKLPIL